MINAGPNVLRLLPPLIVGEAEIDRLIDVLAQSLGAG
jgi:4-aminobutyrate aminotransferase-like enzyme